MAIAQNQTTKHPAAHTATTSGQVGNRFQIEKEMQIVSIVLRDQGMHSQQEAT